MKLEYVPASRVEVDDNIAVPAGPASSVFDGVERVTDVIPVDGAGVARTVFRTRTDKLIMVAQDDYVLRQVAEFALGRLIET